MKIFNLLLLLLLITNCTIIEQPFNENNNEITNESNNKFANKIYKELLDNIKLAIEGHHIFYQDSTHETIATLERITEIKREIKSGHLTYALGLQMKDYNKWKLWQELYGNSLRWDKESKILK